ncbi:MAG: hypothetical protein ACOX9A_15880 [Anaerolineae bacterium]|jgi:hypothetical protein
MRIGSGWSSAVLAKVSRIPLVRRLDLDTLKPALLGAVGTGLFCLVIGAVMGSLNRGAIGTLIGAVSGALFGAMLGASAGTAFKFLRGEKTARATIEIQMESNDRRYIAGETVEGHIRIAAENTFRTTGGRAYLVCRGFYTYDTGSQENGNGPEFHRETHEYFTREIPVVPPGRIKEGLSLRYPFAIPTPRDGLPTHHGYACDIRWTVHTVIDTPSGPLVAPPQEIKIEAMPPRIEPSVRGYQSISSAQVCQVTLSLPRAVYAEGETITGRVRVSPIESFDADEVRVLLLRIENAAVGDDHIVYIDRWDAETGRFRGHVQPGGKGTTYVWLENDQTLANACRFGIADPEEYRFDMDIPVEWRPTLMTADGGVMWKVGVIVARPDGADVRAFHEVIVHTSIPEMGDVYDSIQAMDTHT